MRITKNDKCANFFNYAYLNLSSYFCVLEPTTTMCHGDDGGSATVLERGLHTLIGIISHVSSTCESEHPVALISIVHYLDWISRMTQIHV